jgi:hypothetical protein
MRQRLLNPPLIYRWGEPGLPLPVCHLRPGERVPAFLPGDEGPPWLTSGTWGQPFDFCGHVQRLCADIARSCPERACFSA